MYLSNDGAGAGDLSRLLATYGPVFNFYEDKMRIVYLESRKREYGMIVYDI
jgi:hypothetical protein